MQLIMVDPSDWYSGMVMCSYLLFFGTICCIIGLALCWSC
jgi:hypothetical protein